MITAYTLFSGSGGNCIYIKNAGSEILIDAGKNALTIEKSLNALGTSLNNISAIFITHEHSDHVGALGTISKKYSLPVYITRPSFYALTEKGLRISSCAVEKEPVYEVSVGGLNIRSFEIPHDSAQNVGYVIRSDDGDVLGIATDMGHVTDEIKESLLPCHSVIVESNHDTDMLKNGKYPYFLKRRILSDRGHLANEDCASLVCFLADKGVRNFTLAHLSRENNTPSAAVYAVRSALDKRGFTSAVVKIASPVSAVCVSG